MNDGKDPIADEEELNKRHAYKMAKKKAARDKILATKTEKRGLVIVHTGKGKGKSTAAMACPAGTDEKGGGKRRPAAKTIATRQRLRTASDTALGVRTGWSGAGMGSGSTVPYRLLRIGENWDPNSAGVFQASCAGRPADTNVISRTTVTKRTRVARWFGRGFQESDACSVVSSFSKPSWLP